MQLIIGTLMFAISLNAEEFMDNVSLKCFLFDLFLLLTIL